MKRSITLIFVLITAFLSTQAQVKKAANLDAAKQESVNLSKEDSIKDVKDREREELVIRNLVKTYKRFDYFKQRNLLNNFIFVSVARQKLYLVKEGKVLAIYPISTSAVGTGNVVNSALTPTGMHAIASKLGYNIVKGSYYVNKQWIKPNSSNNMSFGPDPMTSRVFLLTGLEEGYNKGGNVDTHRRGIYIHGTPFEDKLEEKLSAGCIRMKNADIIKLFEEAFVGMSVLIVNE